MNEELERDHDLGRDKDGLDDDAYELRETLRDIGACWDLPALVRRQAGSE